MHIGGKNCRLVHLSIVRIFQPHCERDMRLLTNPCNPEGYKMNEAELFAVIGRKQMDFDNLNVEYDRLLSLLDQVISGQIQAQSVTVDIAARKWTIAVPDVAPVLSEADPTTH